MEDDFIVGQLKLIGEGIGVVLKKESPKEALGEIEKKDGTRVSRMDTVLQYIAENRISEAFALVNALKYRLSFYEFQGVSDWFMKQLKEYQHNKPDLLSINDLHHYQTILDDLL